MLRQPAATPCPINGPRAQAGRRDSIFSVGEDSTANIDFTTEFKASFRDVKPRRPPGKAKKPVGTQLGFTIHEDEELRIQQAVKPQVKDYTGISRAARRTSISQAPQRPSRRVSFAQAEEISEPPPAKPVLSSSIHKAPRRASLQIAAHADLRHASIDDTLPAIPSPKISKPARRGTIYIPNDDTTMPSMYMGIFSPLKAEPQHTGQGQEGAIQEHTGLAAQIHKKRVGSRRQSVLVASPKRGPLHAATKPLQATLVSQNRIGNGPGKENLPPGFSRQDEGLMKKKPRKSILVSRIAPVEDRPTSRAGQPVSRLCEPSASFSERMRASDPASRPAQKPAWNSGVRPPSTSSTSATSVVPQPKPPSPIAAAEVQPKTRVPTRFIVPSIKVDSIDQTFPLLPEGLREASMYEDNWLGQQEVAITQLINNLFAASGSGDEASDAGLLRIQLLDQYNSPDTALMYKRVQGALLHGALRIPQDVLVGGHRLYNDLGRRKGFVDLWLDTYHGHLLHRALEVVTGRVITIPRRSSGSSSPSAVSVKCKRVLRLFIETFLLRNEDGHPDSETSQKSWSYSRTLLRSLMLIKVLDLMKTNPGLLSSSLFQATSPRKASSSVLQALMQMLNPSVGDPIRALSHLGYTLCHAQFPLEEYEYHIENLAVDLRDGVRLTRLVELLLYRSASIQVGHKHEADATTTLLMPTGEVLGLVDGPRDWPLSQHLKFPCISRATKFFNVQIALSAIQNVRGMESMTHDISAEDIVDGFREKTMKLLWGLTSKLGLEGLVNWNDVRSEIRHLGRVKGHLGYSYGYFNDLDVDEEDEGYLQCKALLKAWAKAVASVHGLTVRNFTTSFAHGRVFEAIVDEYEPYLTSSNQTAPKRVLSDRLKALGCSEQFAQLFATGPGATAKHHIFDRDFVLASLAFLCSRLLGPSKRARAAVIVQRAWRKCFEKTLEKRKQKLNFVATACANVVQCRQRDEEAKKTIVGAWRRYKARKLVPSTSSQELPVQRIARIGVDETKGEESDIWLGL